MRITMFSETFLPGTDGVVTRLCATLRHLEKEEHQVLLFAPQGAPNHYASARIVGIPSFKFTLYPEKKFARPLPRVGRILKEFQPDLIHAVNPGFLGFSAIYYARRFKIPLIASYHTHIPTYARYYRLSWLEPFLWSCFRLMHNHADINLCPSEATLAELESRGFKNLELWDRGVDLALYSHNHRSPTVRSTFIPHQEASHKLLLFVGRLAAEKGLEKLRPILDAMPNVHLAIVGDGPYRATLERVFDGSQTVFTGYLFGEELARVYASADGFIFPSTTETLGLVLYEAMASDLPIMAADSPATREVLEHGRAGLIFDPLDTQSISDTVTDLLYNEKVRTEIQSRAAEIVASLDWQRSTEQLLRQYHRLFEAGQKHLVEVP